MLKRILLLCAIAGLGACTTQPTRKKPNVKPDASVATLYTRMDHDTQRYQTALTAAQSGDAKTVQSAQDDADAALDDLQTAAQQCENTPGCQTDRFFTTFDHLLRAQAVPDTSDENNNDAPQTGDEAGESSPVIAALPQTGRSVALLKGHKLADIITINDPMKVALELWLTQYRPNLMRAYHNYEFMRRQMWPNYRKAGLPEALLFGILAQESGGKVHAVSRSGASGPLQFMSATGARFGLGVVNGFDQRFDPAMAAKANAAYINEQLGQFNDDLELALAAYNGGEGAMRRLAARHPDVSFWNKKIYFSVSRETRNYVPMVLAAAWLFLHPDRYNLHFPQIDAKVAAVKLKQPGSIDELTVCLGQAAGNVDGWFRTLRNLNPQLDPRQHLDAGTTIHLPQRLVEAYAGSCTQGPWLQLASDLHSAALPVAPPPRIYVVRKGDTLGAIARRHKCRSARALAQRNHIRPPHYLLHIGQHLHVSQCRR